MCAALGRCAWAGVLNKGREPSTAAKGTNGNNNNNNNNNIQPQQQQHSTTTAATFNNNQPSNQQPTTNNQKPTTHNHNNKVPRFRGPAISRGEKRTFFRDWTWNIFCKLSRQGNQIAPLDGIPKPDPYEVVLCTVFVGNLKRAPSGSHMSVLLRVLSFHEPAAVEVDAITPNTPPKKNVEKAGPKGKMTNVVSCHVSFCLSRGDGLFRFERG